MNKINLIAIEIAGLKQSINMALLRIESIEAENTKQSEKRLNETESSIAYIGMMTEVI